MLAIVVVGLVFLLGCDLVYLVANLGLLGRFMFCDLCFCVCVWCWALFVGFSVLLLLGVCFCCSFSIIIVSWFVSDALVCSHFGSTLSIKYMFDSSGFVVLIIADRLCWPVVMKSSL